MIAALAGWPSLPLVAVAVLVPVAALERVIRARPNLQAMLATSMNTTGATP